MATTEDSQSLREAFSLMPSPDSSTRKRPRRSENTDCAGILNTANERRRVNPESLALRLGPTLVRELDAIIPPGSTDMPTFAVRKRIQEKYNLDRRHIYDYYHSKGLRVVKEDKHSNLVRARAQSHGAAKKVPRLSSQLSPRAASPTTPPRHPSSSQAPRKTSNLSRKFTYIPEPSSSPSPQLSASGPVFAPTVHLVNPLEHLFRDEGDSAGDFLSSLNLNSGLEECVLSSPIFDTRPSPGKSSSSPISAIWLSPHQTPLSREERNACYRRLDSDIGPPDGIQELVGSYQMFMMAQSRRNYERLFSCYGFEQSAPGDTPISCYQAPVSMQQDDSSSGSLFVNGYHAAFCRESSDELIPIGEKEEGYSPVTARLYNQEYRGTNSNFLEGINMAPERRTSPMIRSSADKSESLNDVSKHAVLSSSRLGAMKSQDKCTLKMESSGQTSTAASLFSTAQAPHNLDDHSSCRVHKGSSISWRRCRAGGRKARKVD